MFLSFKRQDWLLNSAIIFLAFLSLITITSVAPPLFTQQLIWFAGSFLLIFLVSLIDWRTASNYRWLVFLIYFSSVVLLLITLFAAPVIRGTRSWLVFGPARFQPSEFAKVALIVLFSYFFAKKHVGIAHFRNLALSFFYVIIPTGIIFLQPDWGSALIILGLWASYLLVSGIKWRHLAVGLVLGVIFLIVSWIFFLRVDQRERIIGFFRPSYEPTGVNYSVIQSKIAIGSAGLFGKGFRQGTQTQLHFLPEPATDFAFAAFVEEWGLVGGVTIIGFFLFLILRLVKIGLASESNFPRFLCLGSAMLFLLEFIFNVGSNVGLLPVVGVTFPFFSYGGSSLLTKAMLIGIIQGIVARTSS